MTHDVYIICVQTLPTQQAAPLLYPELVETLGIGRAGAEKDAGERILSAVDVATRPRCPPQAASVFR